MFIGYLLFKSAHPSVRPLARHGPLAGLEVHLGSRLTTFKVLMPKVCKTLQHDQKANPTLQQLPCPPKQAEISSEVCHAK
jgi:hypothetical protein